MKKISFSLAEIAKPSKLNTAALRSGIAIANSMSYTKDLANTPANICTPTYLAEEATKLSKKHPQLHCDILDRKAMKKLGMGAILAVAQGSNEEPKLVVLKYNGVTNTKNKAHAAPIVIIGKGITFDTGGNSIKTPALMIGMKYDMAGAATILGLMRFVAELNLPLNVIGIMACAENMPGGTAIRPDDIITSMAGMTIEVANTDAEGRLVLCDALTYSTRFKPKAVIDVATLTGACVVALGRHHSGLFSNDDSLAKELLSAGITTGDRCWQLPISEEYQSQLDSTHADVVNVGGPEAGSITGACFLARFATDLRWAHLDVAGTATSKDKVATGRPVPLLAQYLLNQLG